MRSRRTGLAMAFALVALTAPAIDARAAPLATLGPGDSFFWDGRVLRNGDAARYTIDLDGTGSRLRVAIEVPDRTDFFRLRVTGPTPSTQAVAVTDYAFNAEVFIDEPPRGRWTIEVISETAEPTAFRARAKLEPQLGDRTSGRPRARLPNLRAVAPYEFTFTAPVPGPHFFLGDGENQHLEVGGERPLSCSPDETADYPSTRCLRFTAGIENAGAGPFELTYTPLPGTVTGPTMYQVVHYSDGTTKKREAGTYEYHPTHAHYHYTDIWSFKLFDVKANQKLRDVGRGEKSGFCPGDQRFAEWRRFAQDPIYTDGGCTLVPVGEGRMALSTGWGDIYRWYRPGNFVDFSDLEDGLYVLRVDVDVHDWVLETNEKDNATYGLVRIKGEDIKLLERGRGTSPWDPNKIVLRDWWKVIERRS